MIQVETKNTEMMVLKTSICSGEKTNSLWKSLQLKQVLQNELNRYYNTVRINGIMADFIRAYAVIVDVL
jgi:hypothetical protein